jgi:hypothetical protein
VGSHLLARRRALPLRAQTCTLAVGPTLTQLQPTLVRLRRTDASSDSDDVVSVPARPVALLHPDGQVFEILVE